MLCVFWAFLQCTTFVLFCVLIVSDFWCFCSLFFLKINSLYSDEFTFEAPEIQILDKITAKTSEIVINLGEIKKFGPLEIKVLKCGKINSDNKNDSVAYVEVKDMSENQNEKVFIFNGWTFSSDPTIAPFDHAIYDLQLVECNNV